MCVVVILNHVHPGFPVIVAANRDEFYARASTPPRAIGEARTAPPGEGRSPLNDQEWIAGLDGARPEHGTWMGATRGGFLAAITNQRTFAPADPALRSRGEIVLDVLRAGTVAGADAYLAGLDPRRYNPFNLLYGDAHTLRVAYGRDAARLEIVDVPQGLHILPNDVLDSPAFPKVDRLRAVVRPDDDALAAALADHEIPEPRTAAPRSTHAPLPPEIVRQLGAVCIHTPSYGTRSSTIIALGPDGRLLRYLYADGPPCTTPYATIFP